MYLLDTDTLVHMHSGNENVTRHVRADDDQLLATTVISRVELLRGRFDFLVKANDGEQLLRAQRLLDETDQRLSELLILQIDHVAAATFDRLRSHRSLRKIGRNDLLIACMAIAHRATLVTRNLRDFRQVPGLNVVNWVD